MIRERLGILIDRLPDHPQIVVAQGAAHVFKFSSLVGKITAQLATTGTTSYPIGAFALDRPALTDPTKAFALGAFGFNFRLMEMNE